MGTLIAMAYPTDLFANQADHTYVKCGTSQCAWGCWGGKTGGTELRRGAGSTKRADMIAQPDERAGIKCYLVNGVCHQAANRILLPARITVSKAKGYSISEAIYGTYGKVGTWPCKSPFEQHTGVGGDLPSCVEPPGGGVDEISRTVSDDLEGQYLKSVLAIYGEAEETVEVRESDEGSRSKAKEVSLKLFMNMARFRLRDKIDATLSKNLETVRGQVESTRTKFEAVYANKEMSPLEFADEFDAMTIKFQDEMAGLLSPDQYEAFFDLKPDERVVLADRDIIKTIFGEG